LLRFEKTTKVEDGKNTAQQANLLKEIDTLSLKLLDKRLTKKVIVEWTERVIKKMEVVGMFDDMVKHQEVLNSGDVKMTISWIFNNLKRYYSNLDETEVERALIEADKVAFRQNEPMDDLNRQIEALGKKRVDSPQSRESRINPEDSGIID